ncbi:5'-nucleotidase, partial [Paraburkholderia aspalathi]|nr:5'-nucleotidase [Paraburkholderia aspalathi]
MTSNSEKLRAAPLRIGISTRALFDLEEEHKIFIDQGVQAYSEYQRQHENDILAVGSGFNVVQQLLALNEPNKEPYVEVILLSRNSPDLSIRAFKSIEHYDLTVKKGSFISGRSLVPYIDAWDIDLFLSNEVLDVQAASTAAASLGPVSPNWQGKASDELLI